jgi:1,4-alpha-glucan branching enzyme
MSMLWKLQLGAMPDTDGCNFRVWAPDAKKVYAAAPLNAFCKRQTVHRALFRADLVSKQLIIPARTGDTG